jgi:hypothetical protein
MSRLMQTITGPGLSAGILSTGNKTKSISSI